MLLLFFFNNWVSFRTLISWELWSMRGQTMEMTWWWCFSLSCSRFSEKLQRKWTSKTVNVIAKHFAVKPFACFPWFRLNILTLFLLKTIENCCCFVKFIKGTTLTNRYFVLLFVASIICSATCRSGVILHSFAWPCAKKLCVIHQVSCGYCRLK